MLDSLEIVVLIVSFESRASVVRYASEPGLPGAVVADTQRELFAGYAMGRASVYDVWGPKTWWAYARSLLGGAKLRSSTGDTSQRGGNVLIDPEGIVQMHHVGRGPSDRPSVSTISEVVLAATERRP